MVDIGDEIFLLEKQKEALYQVISELTSLQSREPDTSIEITEKIKGLNKKIKTINRKLNRLYDEAFEMAKAYACF